MLASTTVRRARRAAVAAHGDGMGWGDAVLAPMLGLIPGWLGWGQSIVGVAAGFVAAAVAAVVLIVSGGTARRSTMPFGPFVPARAAVGAFVGGLLRFALAGTGA
jgi:leader peptidase (prepilin peptidase) / N-methyltransferase